MMHIWDPRFTRTCVQSYVIGRIQYGSALYWLRATKASIRKARFDYVQAMASCCGLTAPEVVGLARCGKTPSITEENESYQKLCKFLNLPTLKDLAVKQARRMIAQWSCYEPNLFIIADEKIIDVKAPEGSLLSDIFKLSLQELPVALKPFRSN